MTRNLWCVGVVALWLSACSSEHAPHGNLSGVLWVQHSGEYEALTQSAYRQAREQLDRALADPGWTALLEQTGEYSELPPAIITDVDETILSNAPYRARLIRDQTAVSKKRWFAWAKEAQAPAIPGALDFFKYAASRGVTILYVTNRRFELEEVTRRNLESLGFPLVEGADVILTKAEQEDWGSNKRARRMVVAEKYRVLLLLGDALHDFITETRRAPNEERQALTRRYQENWGTKWIVLPNPMEGPWEQATYGFDNSTGPHERRQRKLEALELLRGP